VIGCPAVTHGQGDAGRLSRRNVNPVGMPTGSGLSRFTGATPWTGTTPSWAVRVARDVGTCERSVSDG
jgi:ribosomal protein L3